MYPESRVSLPTSTRPPSGASTRAAAPARRRANSTVIGCVPTRPRTPSVPKYRMVSRDCPAMRRSPPRLPSASAVSRTSCARMILAPLIAATTAAATLPARRSPSAPPVSAPIMRLRDRPASTGNPSAAIAARPREQREVVLEGLAEAESRVDDQPRARRFRPRRRRRLGRAGMPALRRPRPS